MIVQIKLNMPEKASVKDPQETRLGMSILNTSIELIDSIGFEKLTFKKLATEIGTTEASIYRYFENKNQLLQYLFAWYWSWMHYRIITETRHLDSVQDKLFHAIDLLISRNDRTIDFPTIQLDKLFNLIENEGVKSLLTKNIESVNQSGAFRQYKEVVSILSSWILHLSPQFQFPNMLVTTIIEGAHMQHYFATHLPRLTNSDEHQDTVKQFYHHLLHTMIISPQS
jgi:AcrR family transcriptional regulator